LRVKNIVVPFPIYYRTGAESLREVAERLLTVLRLSNPNLVTQAPVSWPQMRRLGVNTGIVLTALSCQLTEAEDLLFHTLEWERSGRFAAAISRYPEASPAVSYFRDHYLPLSRTEKNRLTATFLDHIFPFIVDPALRAVFSARSPGIDWKVVEQKGQTVILDFRNILTDETKRFAMLWVFSTLYEFIKQRGRKDFPFSVLIDEFASLTQQVTSGVNPLAVLLDEFINQYMRNNNIWLTVAHQSIYQLDEQLRNTLLSLGNYVFGRVATMGEARVLADALFYSDPYRVKRYHNVWGHADVPPLKIGNFIVNNEDAGYFVLERVPEYMELSEQLELSAQQLCQQHLFEFLLRPALREGEVSRSVIPISIANYLRDSENGAFQFPDQHLVNTYRKGLAERSGIPVATILKEQEQRLISGTTHEPHQATLQQVTTFAPVTPSAGVDGNGSQPSTENKPFSLPNRAHPESYTVRKNPPHPTLDEDHLELLTYLMDHPDSPVSVVYKEVGVMAAKITQIRDELKAQGLVTDLEVRTGRITAGRPTKFIIPTFAALELVGIDPPAGRGGVIHRAIQHTICEAALQKGYIAKVEQTLPSGAILDVHVEKGGEKIAVEIAVVSKPSRELAHIRQCLQAGYDKVCTIFADPQLLEKTNESLAKEFSAEERGKVQLIPLGKLSLVG